MLHSEIVRYARARLPGLTLYVTSTGALTLGLGAQFIAFVVLARHLGTDQFGKLQTISAVTDLAAAVCGFGAGDTMIRRVVRDQSLYPVVLGHSLILILSTGVALTVLATAGLAVFINSADPLQHLGSIAVLAFSNIVLFKWIGLTEQIFLARGIFLAANIVNTGFVVFRSIVTIAACFLFTIDTVWNWALWYGALHLFASTACALAVRRYGAPHWHLIPDEVRRGFYLITPFFFNVLRQNVDLLAVSMVSPPATVGRYGAASRIATMSLVTVHSFNRLVYPKLALTGRQGTSATFRLAARYVIPAASLALATSVCIFIFAPYAPILFGAGYDEMVVYLRLLCWIPVLVAIQNAIYDALGAADRHGLRAAVYNSGCVAGSILIICLTMFFGLSGTIAGIYIAQGSIAAALWLTGFVARDIAQPP
jgi:O-antigen/teichoic acid export membrane protein